MSAEMNAISTPNVSVSPHARSKVTTQTIMRDVLIALAPPAVMGVYAHGWKALLIILVTTAVCMATEYLYEHFMKLPRTTSDLSAAVTGVILALNMPVDIPLWMPALGGVFAILIVKMLFGGIGQNFMNPALAARCFMLVSFATAMTKFPETVRLIFDNPAVSGPTPMAGLKAGNPTDWFDMLFNTHSGSIGEASAIAILLGLVYLLIRRVIHIRIPAIYILSAVGFVAAITAIRGDASSISLDFLMTHACGGGLLLGAVFMATDYTTSPVTPWGQVIYALILGLLTALFRTIGSSVEGVSYAIIIGNMLTPLIEKFTAPKHFGYKRPAQAAKGGKA